ncbi:MAG: tRNA (adenosine(37)-N6)-threonylcarbamoyltransferase complex dimerization subunit type 1 TsaB [Lachnospiraceae bacterium]|nr:tRNA (adenosine(37)-N6)-threonylcarbamoyltransferase complex dimerization subunit type 1 TsaB [Lachnospiraceae bacterium]
MKILAIESSGNVASAAIAGEDKILAEYTVNIGKTHSQTLLPMIDRILSDAEMSVNELDAIAVSRGPGSFTGLRIGSATAKGLAAAAGIPIVDVPTLEALAVGVGNAGGRLICPVIDARRNEVYSALFEEEDKGSGKGAVRMIGEERALGMEALLSELEAMDREIIFTGDALRVHADKIKAAGNGKFMLAPLSSRDLRAGCVATIGLYMLESGKAVEGSDHTPVYLRLSSAERERLEQGKTLG